jgi:hypothetical protein
MHYVTEASYLDGYRLQLTFNDCRRGIVDLTDTICSDHRPIFLELKDKEKFRRFHVDMDTVVWDNGLDLAPEYLYDKLKDTKTNDDFFDKMDS